MSDSDFTKRIQVLEKDNEEFIAEIRLVHKRLNQIEGAFNSLVREINFILNQKAENKKIVTLN